MKGEQSKESVQNTQSNITNLCSTFSLSTAQRTILERGLTFIPTPLKTDKMQLRKDLHLYHRRLKILDHFAFQNNCPVVPFTEASKWEPDEASVPPYLRQLMDKDLVALTVLGNPVERKQNMTLTQREELRKLTSNPEIVIKPADKGGQIVLQDRAHYLKEALRQLEDKDYYKPLQTLLQSETQTLVRACVDRMFQSGFINKKQKVYLYGPDDPRPRRFYLLPKIHKSPDTQPRRFRTYYLKADQLSVTVHPNRIE